jgi:Holliday junction resolvase RusA-like endonuclease
MAKSRRTIVTVLPTYQRDRQQWRRKILAKVRRAAREAGVQYDSTDRLEVVVLLYLSEGKRLAIHDVDNRLKDILDALQGRFGASLSKSRLIANDRQICRFFLRNNRFQNCWATTALGQEEYC